MPTAKKTTGPGATPTSPGRRAVACTVSAGAIGRVNGRFVASAVAAGLLLAAAHGHAPPVRPDGQHGAAGYGRPSPAAATAIAYARAQLGKPYVWGGTGPDAFDCSGLVQMA